MLPQQDTSNSSCPRRRTVNAMTTHKVTKLLLTLQSIDSRSYQILGNQEIQGTNVGTLNSSKTEVSVRANRVVM